MCGVVDDVVDIAKTVGTVASDVAHGHIGDAVNHAASGALHAVTHSPIGQALNTAGHVVNDVAHGHVGDPIGSLLHGVESAIGHSPLGHIAEGVGQAINHAAHGDFGGAAGAYLHGLENAANSAMGHSPLGHAGGGAASTIVSFDEGDALMGKRTDVHSSNDRYGNHEPNDVQQNHGHGHAHGSMDGFAALGHAIVDTLEQAAGQGHGGVNHGLGNLFDQLASGQNHGPHGGEHHGLGDPLSQLAHMEQQLPAGHGEAHGHAFADAYHAQPHTEPHHDFATAHADHGALDTHYAGYHHH